MDPTSDGAVELEHAVGSWAASLCAGRIGRITVVAWAAGGLAEGRTGDLPLDASGGLCQRSRVAIGALQGVESLHQW